MWWSCKNQKPAKTKNLGVCGGPARESELCSWGQSGQDGSWRYSQVFCLFFGDFILKNKNKEISSFEVLRGFR